MADTYRIRNSAGSYYAGMSGVGPRFGATKADAKTFSCMADAAKEMGKHAVAFGDCEIESGFLDEDEG